MVSSTPQGPPPRLGPYTLLEKLGQGGMGEVHLAHDSRLERKVALKLLPPDLRSDPERRTRFLREARAAAQLSHPNVTQIFDVGEADGLDYIAFEFVEGRTLADLLAERPLQLSEVVDLALPLADALSYAHERGIVHRDLKPANVMVTQRGHAKLLDFGLAKILQEGAQGPLKKTTTLTLQGAIFGTPNAMSPEQALGQPLDARSDVFSFGSLLYEMASGRAAFTGTTVMEVMDAVIHREPPPLARARPELPQDFVAIVEKALRKNPAERYQTMSDLAADLRHFKRTTDSGLVPPAVPQRSRRLVLVSAGLLALAVLAWWTLNSRREPGEESASRRSLAVLPFTLLAGGTEDDGFAAGLHSDILTNLSKISALKVISRTSVMEYQDTRKTARQIGEELDVAALLTGELQRSGNALRLNLTLHDARTDDNLWAESYNREVTAQGIFEVQSDIAEEVARTLRATLTAGDREHLQAPPTKNDEAYALFLTAGTELEKEKPESMRRAAAGLESAVQLDPEFALAWASLGRARALAYWLNEAKDLELRAAAFAAARRSLEIAPGLPEGHLSLGLCHYVARDYERAEQEFETAGRGLPNSVELLRYRSFLHRRLGRLDESLVELGQAIERSPRDDSMLLDQGTTLHLLGRYDEAERFYGRSMEVLPYEATVTSLAVLRASRDGTVAGWEEALARVQRDVDRPIEALQEEFHLRLCARDYASARAGLEQGPERLASQTADYPRTLPIAILAEVAGDREAARQGYEAARATLEADVAATPDDARLHSALGLALAGLDRREEALREGRRATELLPIARESIVGSQRVLDRFHIELRVGALDEALTSLEEYLAHPSFWSLRGLRLDPRLDALKDQPGFQALVERFDKR